MKASVTAVVDGLQTTADGKLDATTIKNNKPSFAEAVDQGMRWFKMHWGCPYVWPGLTPLIQSAPNTVSSSQQGEAEMARLQAIPDELPVPTSEQAANSLFGNAVCVDVTRGIFESLFLRKSDFF